MAAPPMFRETNFWTTPIRDLGLTIEGTKLAPILDEFHRELERAGIRRLRPTCYLSTEWGVNFGTIAIGIPFYLARPDLMAIHAERTGHLEGTDRADILRYLRHEMGHVVNYGYQLYEQQDWVKVFGAMTQPYLDDYRPEPFNRRFVRHLPGWYAQKHPDEDWAETFAVWMTPGYDWRTVYAEWPETLAKLHYCDRIMALLRDRDPVVTDTERDEDVSELAYSLEDYYRKCAAPVEQMPPGVDGALQAIFEDQNAPEDSSDSVPRRSAAKLIRRMERDLLANVYRWTGHFPERTRPMLNYLANRAEQLQQVYPATQEDHALVALTTLVTALAMNYVHRGTYLP